jgi:hypothetical protein
LRTVLGKTSVAMVEEKRERKMMMMLCIKFIFGFLSGWDDFGGCFRWFRGDCVTSLLESLLFQIPYLLLWAEILYSPIFPGKLQCLLKIGIWTWKEGLTFIDHAKSGALPRSVIADVLAHSASQGYNDATLSLRFVCFTDLAPLRWVYSSSCLGRCVPGYKCYETASHRCEVCMRGNSVSSLLFCTAWFVRSWPRWNIARFAPSTWGWTVHERRATWYTRMGSKLNLEATRHVGK